MADEQIKQEQIELGKIEEIEENVIEEERPLEIPDKADIRPVAQNRGDDIVEEALKFNQRYDQISSNITSQLTKLIQTVATESNIDPIIKNSLIIEPKFHLGEIRKGWAETILLEGAVDFYIGKFPLGIFPKEGGKKEKLDFFVKSFPNSNNEHLQLNSTPLEREYRLYELMEGSGVVPHAYYWEELDNNLILQHGGKMSAEDKLAELTRKRKTAERINLEDRITKVIAKFNKHAALKTPEALQDEIIGPWLKIKKPSIEKAIRYFRKYMELRGADVSEEMIKEFAENFHVVVEMCNGTGVQLVHGDLRGQNIVGPADKEWTEDNIKIVDLGGMGLGNPIASLSQFATSAGSVANYDRWNDQIINYMTYEAALSGIGGGRGIRFLRDRQIDANKKFYFSTIYDSARGLYKMAELRKEHPDEYEMLNHYRPVLQSHDKDMRRNVRRALDYIVKNPDDFDLEDQDRKRVEKVIEIFKKIRKK